MPNSVPCAQRYDITIQYAHLYFLLFYWRSQTASRCIHLQSLWRRVHLPVFVLVIHLSDLSLYHRDIFYNPDTQNHTVREEGITPTYIISH